MSIKIDKNKCVGCKKCSSICPGNLIYMEGKKAIIKYPKDCWGCAACLKECNVEAIKLYIPNELGGSGGFITLKTDGEKIKWRVQTLDEEFLYETNRLESNKY